MILLTGAGERSTVAGHQLTLVSSASAATMTKRASSVLTLAQAISLLATQSFDGPLNDFAFSGTGKSSIDVVITGAGGDGGTSHGSAGSGTGGGGGACVTKSLPLISEYRLTSQHDPVSGFAKITDRSGSTVYALAPDGQDGNSVVSGNSAGGGTAEAISLGGSSASGDTSHTGGNGGGDGGYYSGYGGGGQAATISSNGQNGADATDDGITAAEGGGRPGDPGSGGRGATISSPEGVSGQAPGGGGGAGDSSTGGAARFSFSWAM